MLCETAPEAAVGVVRSFSDETGRHIQATFDVPDRYPRRGLALCLGKLYAPRGDWWLPGDDSPDGSYAIVREDADVLEAVSDPAGSRMLWYYLDDDVFVVSNSERAVTMFAGRFDFDPGVVPWIMSTGTRGPGRSYNRHLRLVPPAGVARLDKADWSLQVQAPDIRFAEIPRSREEHLAALEAALRATFSAFDADDASHMLISLSGGYDSRALATFLAASPDLHWRSFTSGTERAAAMALSDVTIGSRVAAALGLAHRHIVTKPARGQIESRLQRFILLAEGRHDHLNSLQSAGTNEAIRDLPADGIVRGDECFGWKPAPTPLAVRQSMDLLLCGDIANFKGRLARFGLDGHRLPARARAAPGRDPGRLARPALRRHPRAHRPRGAERGQGRPLRPGQPAPLPPRPRGGARPPRRPAHRQGALPRAHRPPRPGRALRHDGRRAAPARSAPRRRRRPPRAARRPRLAHRAALLRRAARRLAPRRDRTRRATPWAARYAPSPAASAGATPGPHTTSRPCGSHSASTWRRRWSTSSPPMPPASRGEAPATTAAAIETGVGSWRYAEGRG